MWTQLFLVIAASSCALAELKNSCVFGNCRWNLVREAEDSSKVIVDDNSVHNINWKWDVKGGYWNVSYSAKYPSEWYSGKAVFVNNSVTSTKKDAFVSWGSNVPWMSNAVPIYSASPWNLTYNGDVWGFVPSENGRYIFRIYTRNKRHNPFGGSEPVVQQPCSFTATDPAKVSKWWQEQKSTKACPDPTLVWNWQGKNGKWTVQYRYVDSLSTYGKSFHSYADLRISIRMLDVLDRNEDAIVLKSDEAHSHFNRAQFSFQSLLGSRFYGCTRQHRFQFACGYSLLCSIVYHRQGLLPYPGGTSTAVLQQQTCACYPHPAVVTGNGLPQMKVINWELDEIKQSVSYATNPVRIYEDAWQVSLGPTETWGFTPTGDGLWIFQHFSQNLVFQPFQNFRGTVMYSASPTSGQSAPMYYAVGTPGQTTPVYSVGSPITTPVYTVGTPIYQVGTPINNPVLPVGTPVQNTPVYTVGVPMQIPPK